jgi:hypothetical protein
MKRLLTCCLTCLSLGGCNASADFFDSLFGIKHNVVILASKTIELSPTEVTFTPTEAEIVGKESRVCVVLGSGKPNAPWKETESDAQGILGGSKISAVVNTANGVKNELQCQGISWARYGRVVPSNEIAACVQLNCSRARMPIGSKVVSVGIAASAPVHALGAYWDSTSAFDGSGN